jgi:hypothetical protein
VREGVDVIPAKFLGKEAIHAGQAAQLWNLRGVAKGVW